MDSRIQRLSQRALEHSIALVVLLVGLIYVLPVVWDQRKMAAGLSKRLQSTYEARTR